MLSSLPRSLHWLPRGFTRPRVYALGQGSCEATTIQPWTPDPLLPPAPESPALLMCSLHRRALECSHGHHPARGPAAALHPDARAQRPGPHVPAQQAWCPAPARGSQLGCRVPPGPLDLGSPSKERPQPRAPRGPAHRGVCPRHSGASDCNGRGDMAGAPTALGSSAGAQGPGASAGWPEPVLRGTSSGSPADACA